MVFLGDYVDRGPDTKKTVEWLCQLQFTRPNTYFLAGNHDVAFMAFAGLLEVPEDCGKMSEGYNGPLWRSDDDLQIHLQGRRYAPPCGSHFQSEATFRSYGVKYGERAALQRAIPPHHAAFFRSLHFVLEHPSYVFVHGGLALHKGNSWEGLSIERQLEMLRNKDMSKPFIEPLQFRGWMDEPVPGLDRTVVCGHVPVREVSVGTHRIMVDTGGGHPTRPISAICLPSMKIVSSE
eukprot:NODE_457_length_1727_cov_74.352205_g381_i0.p1 GENE.NODE_457_length_1727_cov_74.352205_g381_i0~~NODE_457_length_1727_cov_74.352205_g381_i0.p1  ORF type:complete len:235 (+),score=46.02 NODE_457_length_1727_cov_74.352205_g381_i0:929-1633(+)